MAKNDTDFDYASASVPLGAIFIAADEPLLVYPSAVAAERHLEAIDVENGVYRAAYGLNGEPYRVTRNGSHVIIEPTGEPARLDELNLLLLRYLEANGHVPVATSTTQDLVATVWAIESEFWREHDPYGDRFGTRIPLWGCICFLALVVILFYLAFQ